MIKKFFILYGVPFTERDWWRFGIDSWIRSGFEVAILDLSDALKVNHGPEQTIQRTLIERPRSLREIESQISRFTDGVTFLAVPRGYYGYRIAQMIAESRTRILRFDSGSIPEWKRSFKRRISQCTLASSIPRKIMGKLFSISLPPDIHVVSSLVSARHAVATTKLYSHTMDYDVYLSTLNTPPIVDGNYAVLLDSAHCMNPDFLYAGERAPASANVYYPAMNKFLSQVENTLGLPVVIAGHPRARYSPDLFAQRRVIQGATCELVRDARFVISMDSTAVSFAVLWKKPIIFVTTQQLRNTVNGGCIEAFADELAHKVINLDMRYCVDDVSQSLAVDELCYLRYRDAFIKYPGTPDIYSWDTIIQGVSAIS